MREESRNLSRKSAALYNAGENEKAKDAETQRNALGIQLPELLILKGNFRVVRRQHRRSLGMVLTCTSHSSGAVCAIFKHRFMALSTLNSQLPVLEDLIAPAPRRAPRKRSAGGSLAISGAISILLRELNDYERTNQNIRTVV
jgi:hypothetical protein